MLFAKYNKQRGLTSTKVRTEGSTKGWFVGHYRDSADCVGQNLVKVQTPMRSRLFGGSCEFTQGRVLLRTMNRLSVTCRLIPLAL
jgi:hypothetical protein